MIRNRIPQKLKMPYKVIRWMGMTFPAQITLSDLVEQRTLTLYKSSVHTEVFLSSA